MGVRNGEISHIATHARLIRPTYACSRGMGRAASAVCEFVWPDSATKLATEPDQDPIMGHYSLRNKMSSLQAHKVSVFTHKVYMSLSCLTI